MEKIPLVEKINEKKVSKVHENVQNLIGYALNPIYFRVNTQMSHLREEQSETQAVIYFRPAYLYRITVFLPHYVVM